MKKFTLVELLVVIAVIGILTSMLLPALHKAKDSAHTTVCINNQKQVGIAQVSYGTDENDAMPPAGNQFANFLGKFMDVPKGNPWSGNDLNQTLVVSGNIFFCPSGLTDRLSEHAKSGVWNWVSFEETMRPWRSRSEDNTKTIGGYDLWFMPVGDGNAPSSSGWKYNNWRVKNPGEDKWPSTNYISDTSRAAATHDGTHHLHSHKGDGSRISARHGNYKKTNVLFYDGHAATHLRSTVYAGSKMNAESDTPVIFQAVEF